MNDSENHLIPIRSATFNGYKAIYGEQSPPFIDSANKTRKVIDVVLPDERHLTFVTPCTCELVLERSDRPIREVLMLYSLADTPKNFVGIQEIEVFNAIVENVCKHTLYEDREDRSQGAVEFFLSEYRRDIKNKEMTLSYLRTIDPKLSNILRQPRHYGAELEKILPRGKSRAGSVIKPLGFDPDSLNPNDERDALVLRALRQRVHAREGMRRLRSARRLER